MISKTIKTAICDIIVVFLFIIILVSGINIFGNKQIAAVQEYISIFETKIENNKKNIKIDPIRKTLIDYPTEGTQYGTISIDSIGIELPLYYGEALSTLKKGVGTSTSGFCPGEGGAVMCMGHNFPTIFRRLGEVENGDIIHISTSYGEYDYQVYDSRIIEETDFDAVPIIDDKEVLYLFTCYPFANIGYADHRFVLYANLVNGGAK